MLVSIDEEMKRSANSAREDTVPLRQDTRKCDKERSCLFWRPKRLEWDDSAAFSFYWRIIRWNHLW